MKLQLCVLLATAFFEFLQLSAIEKLPEKYLVNFGNPNAPVKVTEYFSFYCPHCIAIFQKDFKSIQKDYIHTNEIYWTFHPIPHDLVTVQGMICLEKLNDNQKQLFLETILELTDTNNPEVTAMLMIKAMELFDQPTPRLQSDEFLNEQKDLLTNAYLFLKQEEQIIGIPTVEVNAIIYLKEVPDRDFIVEIMEKCKEKK